MKALQLFGAEGRTDDTDLLAALEVDYTPVGVALQAMLALREEVDRLRRPELRALDPAAGSGCWLRAMASVLDRPTMTGVEPRASEASNLAAASRIAFASTTFEDFVAAHLGTYDLVATNPPFSAFEPPAFWPRRLLEAGLLHSKSVVALLGLTSWGQSEAAAASLRYWSPQLQLRLGGRPAFREDNQTDAREYSLWVWSPEDGHARKMGARPSWRTVQLPVLPAELRRWSPAAVPGTYPIDAALVDEIRRRYL